MKSVTVVIAARDEEPTIARTLNSVLGVGEYLPTRKPNHVIVVDDGSSDRTAQIARSFEGVEVISLGESSGKKSRAQNAALPLIHTDLVMTLDADTELMPDTLEKLIAPHEAPDPPAVTCAYVVSKNPKGVWQRGRFIEYLFGQTFFKKLQSDFNAVLVASGCASVYQTTVLKAVGGFDSQSIGEDMDVTLRIITGGPRRHKRGINKVVLVSDAYVFTTDPSTFKLYRAQMRRWFAAFFQNLIIHKHAIRRFRNRALTMTFIGYIFDGIVGTFRFFYFPLFAWLGFNVGIFWKTLFWIIGLEIIISLFFILYKGVFKLKLPWVTLSSLPFFPVNMIVNKFYFLEAFWREFVPPRKKLTAWEKGH